MVQGQDQEVSTVLLLETDPFLRRLISLGLQHRGLHVLAATSLAELSDVDFATLDLLVMDIDCESNTAWSLLTTVQTHDLLCDVPTIVLAWEYPPSLDATVAPHVSLQTKPFDARRLHEAVDGLLALRSQQRAEQEALLEASVLAAYTRHSSPSVWPLVTAAGLLLAVIGMLLQVVLTIVGILIVVVALLLWTTRTQTESRSNVALV